VGFLFETFNLYFWVEMIPEWILVPPEIDDCGLRKMMDHGVEIECKLAAQLSVKATDLEIRSNLKEKL